MTTAHRDTLTRWIKDPEINPHGTRGQVFDKSTKTYKRERQKTISLTNWAGETRHSQGEVTLRPDIVINISRYRHKQIDELVHRQRCCGQVCGNPRIHMVEENPLPKAILWHPHGCCDKRTARLHTRAHARTCTHTRMHAHTCRHTRVLNNKWKIKETGIGRDLLKRTRTAQELLPRINKWDHMKLNELCSKRSHCQSEDTAYRMGGKLCWLPIWKDWVSI